MTSLRLGSSRELIINKMNINFNAWVKSKFDEEFVDETFLRNTIKEDEIKLKIKKKLLDDIINENTKTTIREKKYLIDTKLILKKFGESSRQIEIRFNGYLNKFSKKYLTFNNFIKLVKSNIVI